ncbi:MAG: hypothetical protein HLUCCO18_16515 [Rhodobacteraceae bacterium HLUCCO18]|nr:MAG: hypothetical protein HLUCCO18_16515 [Rhodobacteraceae bacterium HLUCCO18]
MLRVTIALTLCLSLAACGESRLNPFNWFGGEREERITVTEVERPGDPRPLVAEITGLAIEPTTSGAILTATALTETSGHWRPGLVLVSGEDGAASYEFRAAPPPEGATQGTGRSREIVAAVALGPDELRGLRSITVIARTNRRSVERR